MGSLATWLWLVALTCMLARPVEASSHGKITVTVGQSVTQYIASPIKTVSIADDEVADVVVASSHEILVIGQAIGFTNLIVWDQANNSTVYDVVVRGPFSALQIELRVKVAEVNTSKTDEWGIDYILSGEKGTVGVFGGEIASPSIPLPIFAGASAEGVSLALRYLDGATDVSATIHWLEEEGFLRVLAEPTIVAASGQIASFISGGEIPVPIATPGAQGGSTVTIEWKEFGVKVEFLPTIVDSGVINLVVSPEVSSLDFANGLVLTGFRIPALRTRKASTTVELRDGQTLVIGGLIMEEEAKSTRRIPILGHIPLLGFLFRNTQNVITQSELLIVVSAHIIRALPKGTSVDLPGVGKKDG